MNFKELLKEDLDVFINLDEFAELHELDGKPVPVIVDTDSFEEYSSTMELENAMQGIFQSILTIYVKASDYKKPDIGYRLKLDDKYYFVIGVSESTGILQIDLASNES